jgi:hypothetical protein
MYWGNGNWFFIKKYPEKKRQVVFKAKKFPFILE